MTPYAATSGSKSCETRFGRTLERLYRLEPRGITLGLERMQAALQLLGHPERGCPWIHVAGTNGKGSVCAMLASVAKQNGLNAGLYTSPHLHKITERIQVNGVPIDETLFIAIAHDILDTLENHAIAISFFEAMTLIGFVAFKRARCDIGIIEVGLGGRLDATNVITPKLSVITSIGLDHTDRLGHTLEAIAGEKAGIIKRGVPIVVSENAEVVHEVIRTRARQLGCTVLVARPPVPIEIWPEQTWITPAQHQNIATVTAVSHALGWRQDALREGISNTAWPGRFEVILSKAGSPSNETRGAVSISKSCETRGAVSISKSCETRFGKVTKTDHVFILDGAHNAEGCMALRNAINASDYCKHRPRVLLFAAMQDKPIQSMLDTLEPGTDHTLLVRLAFPRAFDPERWVSSRRSITQNTAEGIEHAHAMTSSEGVVVVAGSLYFIAEVRSILLNIPSDPPIQL